ncbi:AraC family transcriptional regulator [Clostridium sp. 'White wine YQ']|uniref:AraC family transcriptional regulator n=1 Tax=Clostridium sp. 'White wine YQ' TaxID=3027474 RepID=UPI002366C7CC|nr:AraC family transcriptional regulator [Clostridium sp. 'White wine YQ']MDD7795849.1 AraC family transcriptional regulator [Clostridium sp. 'White wine YQ']
MKLNNLYFNIHYCNHRFVDEKKDFSKKLTRRINHHELLLVNGGKGYISIEDKRYRIEKGMLFYFNPSMTHTIEVDEKLPMCFLSVHFNYVELSYSEDAWVTKGSDELLPLNSMEKLMDYYTIDILFRKLTSLWDEKLLGYEFASKTILQELLYEILKNIKRKKSNYSTALKVNNIISYLNENIKRKVTLNELSELVKLSPTYLSRSFKEITGYSIIEFFNKMKIDKAKELIIDGDKKVKEVAEVLGFKDEFYFSRIFKRIEGISPSEFYSKNVHGV